MGASVQMTALAERVKEYGPIAYLVTVAGDERPHVVSVRARWDDQGLVVAAGKTTSANVEERPDVTLLWPAPPGRDYGLIVDGTAQSLPGAAEPTLAIVPNGAVLHRTPEGDPGQPLCIKVLPRLER